MNIPRLKNWVGSKDLVYNLLMGITLATAFAIRFPYLFSKRLWPDEALYCWQAQKIGYHPSIMFSKEIILFHPPIFPSLLALGHFFFPSEITYRLIPLFLNLVGILIIYLIGKKISSSFVGFFAASSLTFNYLYVADATHILIDGSLTVMIMLFMLILLHLQEKSSWKLNLSLILIGSCIILLKWSGIIIIFFLIVYRILIFPQRLSLKPVKGISLPFGIMITLTFLLLANNFFQLGHLWPDISAMKGSYKVEPFWFYALNLHNILMIPIFIPFFLYGLFKTWDKTNSRRMLLLIWFTLLFAAISLTPEKLLRYSLLVIPSGLLITGIGLEDFLKKMTKKEKGLVLAKMFCLLSVFISGLLLQPRTHRLLTKTQETFTGFQEAAQDIRNLSSEPVLIVAGSPRIIRYYTWADFQKSGDRLIKIPKDQAEFTRLVLSSGQPILLEVDTWEATQPAWLYPPVEEKFEYLRRLGFKLKKRVKRRRTLPNGKEKTSPVIWIFYRDG